MSQPLANDNNSDNINNSVRLKEIVKKVDGVLGKLKADNIKGMNDIVIYGVAISCAIRDARNRQTYGGKEHGGKGDLSHR